MIDEDEVPGWDAIDRALARRYPGVTPRHYGTVVKWRLGGSAARPSCLNGPISLDRPGYPDR